MKTRKYYPSNDVEVALMFMPEIEGDITLVVDRYEYFPYVRRAIMKTLGTPDRSYQNVMVYAGKYIRIASSSNENSIVGLSRERTFLIESWESGSMNCKCNSPDVAESIQIGTDGRLKQILVCEHCGGQVHEEEETIDLVTKTEPDDETRHISKGNKGSYGRWRRKGFKWK